jgi:hypothetical protein
MRIPIFRDTLLDSVRQLPHMNSLRKAIPGRLGKSIPEIGERDKFLTHIFSFLSDISSHARKTGGKQDGDFSQTVGRDAEKRYTSERACFMCSTSEMQ